MTRKNNNVKYIEKKHFSHVSSVLYHLHKIDKNNYVKLKQSTCAIKGNTRNQLRKIIKNPNLVVVSVGKESCVIVKNKINY